jgi:hypothetical protein
MSKIQNYQKAKFAQVNLDDGNKILVSYGATDMKVFKLGFLSIPKETLHTFKNEFLYALNNKIGYDMLKDVVKILADELAEASSLDEIKNICLRLEEDNDFVEKT